MYVTRTFIDDLFYTSSTKKVLAFLAVSVSYLTSELSSAVPLSTMWGYSYQRAPAGAYSAGYILLIMIQVSSVCASVDQIKSLILILICIFLWGIRSSGSSYLEVNLILILVDLVNMVLTAYNIQVEPPPPLVPLVDSLPLSLTVITTSTNPLK
jgi:hypothetical protein